ncbi:MAG: TIM barrel protein [Pseudolabrys sp.]|nr:TIM barrel protein [Pseudolabrys sp.]
MPRFSAHVGYLFPDRPLLERFDAVAKAGFKAVDMPAPYEVPAAAIKDAVTRNGLTPLGLNTPRHFKDAPHSLAALPGREKDWDQAFDLALEYATTIGNSGIHCMGGIVPDGQRAEAEMTFIANLKRSADIAAAKNVTLLIEPINPRDAPGYFLNRVDHAADIIAKVGKPNVKIQFDFYHVQIVSGDLIKNLIKYFPLVGHLQCAAVPVRHEPDTDCEINYPFVFAEVDKLGYKGWIGAEYHPRGRTEDGLGWATPYGVVPKK